MRAMLVRQPGGPEQLHVADVPDPGPPGDGEVIVDVAAAGVNRADLLQRRGLYPPPPGASDILGLEVSGAISAVGRGVDGWRVGEGVCALLAGGGYAERVAVPAAQLLAAPAGLDPVHAAAIPEAFITAHDALSTRGRLSAGETVLIHGGGGGVGTAAVQLAARLGATVIVTAGSDRKLAACRQLGATFGINYRTDDFVAEAHRHTADRGADVILDVIGASYLERNLTALALDGRLVAIGLQGGATGSIDLGFLLRRRVAVIGTSLRGRAATQKAEIVARVAREVLPGFADGSLRVVIDRVLPMERAAEAHSLVEDGSLVGKVLLRM